LLKEIENSKLRSIKMMLLCNKCGEKYTNIFYKWCKPCEINDLKGNFTNWARGNEWINNFIQEMRSKIVNVDVVFEWITYNQFSDIKEIGRSDFATIYSAIWMDGPLQFNQKYDKSYPNREVALKYYNSQNITNEFLINEV
jgi:hypothetical protein